VAEPVGVVLVGHGRSASALLAAAVGVVGADALAAVVAVDAGLGETADLNARLHDAVVAADRGSGVLLFADVLGASPCTCGIRQALGHRLAVLAGLNLAMLLKLATLDRAAHDPAELARVCAESARRSVAVLEPRPPPPTDPSTAAPAGKEPE
jgi:PTS system mannose-specific IIA component